MSAATSSESGRSSETPVTVRDVTITDLDAVASIHIASFGQSVLARLGDEVMRRYYRWQLTGPHDLIAVVACRGHEVLGFTLGGVFRGSTIGFVRREKWLLVGKVLRHPAVLLTELGWKRIALALRLLARRGSLAHPEALVAAEPQLRSCGVLAIAVHPSAQGLGVGRAMMGEVRRRAEAEGFRRLHLTVSPDNLAAVRFYESLGFERSLEGDGRWRGFLVAPIAPVG